MTALIKDSIITNKNEDGTEYTFDLNICNMAANEALEGLWEKEDVIKNFDFTASVYSLFISCIHILTNSGYSTHELLDTTVTHSEANDICPDCGELMMEDDEHDGIEVVDTQEIVLH
jgi:hypothetical protein